MNNLKNQQISQKAIRNSKTQSKQNSKYSDSFTSQNNTNINITPSNNTENKQTTSKGIINKNQKSLLEEKDQKITELEQQIIKMQKECHKNQIQYLKLESQINNSPTSLNSNRNNIFSNLNTSTNFPLNSEILKTWENFVYVDILNNLIDFEENPEIMFHLLQEMFYQCYKLIKEISEEKYNQMSSILNLPINQDTMKNLENYTRPIFQEHLKNIFNNEESQNDFFQKFIVDYQNFFNQNIDKKYKEIFNEIISTPDFKKMLMHVKEIILFCEFNVPKLSLKIEDSYSKRELEIIDIKNNPPIRKSDMLIVNNKDDKFIKNVLVLLKPPMKNGYIYNKNFKTIVIPWTDQIHFLTHNNNSNCNSNYNLMSNFNITNGKEYEYSQKNSFVNSNSTSNHMKPTSHKVSDSLSPKGRDSIEPERCLTENNDKPKINLTNLRQSNGMGFMISKKLDFSKINLDPKRQIGKQNPKKNFYNIYYCGTPVGGQENTQRYNKRNKSSNINKPTKGEKKDNIIQMIKKTSKNTFQKAKTKKTFNTVSKVKPELRSKSNNKSNINHGIKRKKPSLHEDKLQNIFKGATQPLSNIKNSSKPKSTRIIKNQIVGPIYTVSGVSQIFSDNIKLKKGVVIKVEVNKGNNNNSKKSTNSKGLVLPREFLASTDSNYLTGGLTDETCSNSSQPQEYISNINYNNINANKHFSFMKLTKMKNNLCNSNSTCKTYNNSHNYINGNNGIDNNEK